MSERCLEPGWRLAAMHDPAGRRGIWFRRVPDDITEPLVALEVCGGREGDDYYVRLGAGAGAGGTAEQVAALYAILSVSAWVLEEAREAEEGT